MALSSNVFEQLRREPSRIPGWSGKLLLFSGTVLFVSILSLVGLQYGYKPYLEEQISNLQRESQKFAQEIPVSTREEIVQFYSQLANIKTLLGSHITATKLLDFLEARTLPGVYYDKFVLNAGTRELQLGGKARSMQEVGAQLAVFQNDPMVKKVTVRTLNADLAGIWSFDTTLSLDPSLLGQVAIATASSTGSSIPQ